MVAHCYEDTGWLMGTKLGGFSWPSVGALLLTFLMAVFSSVPNERLLLKHLIVLPPMREGRGACLSVNFGAAKC